MRSPVGRVVPLPLIQVLLGGKRKCTTVQCGRPLNASVHGWQVRHPGGVPFAVLIACLIVAMAVVYFTQQAGPGTGKARKGRSTDRVD